MTADQIKRLAIWAEIQSRELMRLSNDKSLSRQTRRSRVFKAQQFSRIGTALREYSELRR